MFFNSIPVVRKNSIQASCGDLPQPILVVQSAEHCVASEHMSSGERR